MAQKKGLPSVFPHYMDSIHGFALSKEGLLVAANCQSCHGSHDILSHKDPSSPTFKANIPQDLRQLPRQDQRRLPGRRARPRGRGRQPEGSGLLRLPHRPRHSAAHRGRLPHAVHAHLRLLPQGQALAPIATPSTRSSARWAATSKRRAAGTATRRTISTPRPIRIRPSIQANLVTTCGKCHAGANLSFVQYQPHANAHDRKLNPALYFVRLFMNLLLVSVLTFFVIHTALVADSFPIRPGEEKSANGGQSCLSSGIASPKTEDQQPETERFFVRFTRAAALPCTPCCSPPSWASPAPACLCASARASGRAAGQRSRRIRRHSLLSQVLRTRAHHSPFSST